MEKRVIRHTSKTKSMAERNLDLYEILMRYFLARPEVFSSLPDKFELVILPEDDPELRQFNLELLDKYSREDKPVVFARLKSSQEIDFE